MTIVEDGNETIRPKSMNWEPGATFVRELQPILQLSLLILKRVTPVAVNGEISRLWKGHLDLNLDKVFHWELQSWAFAQTPTSWNRKRQIFLSFWTANQADYNNSLYQTWIYAQWCILFHFHWINVCFYFCGGFLMMRRFRLEYEFESLVFLIWNLTL